MAGHPVQLAHEHADPHRSLGEVLVDAEQLLGGQREGELVEERTEVVHPCDVRGPLQVGQGLACLLHAGVQVADDGLAAQDGLALQLEHEAQHTVGAGVLRPHVDDHRLVLVRILREVAEQRRLGLAHPQHRTELAHQLLGPDLRPRLELLLGLRRLGNHRHGDTLSLLRASERQRASGQQRPAWPGNAVNVIKTARL